MNWYEAEVRGDSPRTKASLADVLRGEMPSRTQEELLSKVAASAAALEARLREDRRDFKYGF